MMNAARCDNLSNSAKERRGESEISPSLDRRIDREGRHRRVIGRPPPKSKVAPDRRGVAQSRRASQFCRLGRMARCGIIGERRRSIAHLHRPWRAKNQRLTLQHRRFAVLRKHYGSRMRTTGSRARIDSLRCADPAPCRARGSAHLWDEKTLLLQAMARRKASIASWFGILNVFGRDKVHTTPSGLVS